MTQELQEVMPCYAKMKCCDGTRVSLMITQRINVYLTQEWHNRGAAHHITWSVHPSSCSVQLVEPASANEKCTTERQTIVMVCLKISFGFILGGRS